MEVTDEIVPENIINPLVNEIIKFVFSVCLLSSNFSFCTIQPKITKGGDAASRMHLKYLPYLFLSRVGKFLRFVKFYK